MFRQTLHIFRRSFCIALIIGVGVFIVPHHVTAQNTDDMGVFTEKSVGCKDRGDLVEYYEAELNNNRTMTGRLISSGKCISLAGRSYIPLRTGFATSAVQMSVNGEQIVIWALTQALVASPPPARKSHFNF